MARNTSKQVEQVAVPCGCRETVALSVLALEIQPPIGQSLRTWLADEVVSDDLGRLAVSYETARRLIAERDAAAARQAEEFEQHRAELAKRYPVRAPVGVPGVNGMSAYESMMLRDRPDGRDPTRRVTPFEEAFGGGR